MVTKIYVLTKIISRAAGHGDYCSYRALAMTGQYESEPARPCFSTRADAEKYLANLSKYHDLKIYELELYQSPVKYYVKYSLAGATGNWSMCGNLLDAEREAQECYQHFCEVANVWIVDDFDRIYQKSYLKF